MRRRKIDSSLARFAISGILMLVLFSCSKTKGSSSSDDNHHDDPNDTTFPVIRIDNPLANQVFQSGDTIKVEAFITDNSLYMGKVKIVNDANGLSVAEQNFESHFQTSYTVIFKHKTSVAVATDYTITVEYQDHGLNLSTQTRKVKVNP